MIKNCLEICRKCDKYLVVKRQPSWTGDNDIHLLNCFTEKQYRQWRGLYLNNPSFDAWTLEKNGRFVKIGGGDEIELSDSDIHCILFNDSHKFEHLLDFDGTTCKFGLELQMMEWNNNEKDYTT